MIKDHAHAIEVLSNCIPLFKKETCELLVGRQIIFKWGERKFILYYDHLEFFELIGVVLNITDVSILIAALIKKELYPGVNFIKG